MCILCQNKLIFVFIGIDLLKKFEIVDKKLIHEYIQ
jgi:hypothetical protein